MAKKKTTDAATPAPRRRTPRPAATVPAITSTASDTPADLAANDPAPDDIAREAYLRYLRRGGDHGRDLDDWLEAERDLRSRR